MKKDWRIKSDCSKTAKVRPCNFPVVCKWEKETAAHYLARQVQKAIVARQRNRARQLIRVDKLLFPNDTGLGFYLFDAYWKLKQYRKAIQTYKKLGCPFALAGQVGNYYDHCGQTKKAMQEYERLVSAYFQMKILPLPRGPAELFKLGRWYAAKDPRKARKYLAAYLRAGTETTGGTNYIRHKKQAESLLNKIV